MALDTATKHEDATCLPVEHTVEEHGDVVLIGGVSQCTEHQPEQQQQHRQHFVSDGAAGCSADTTNGSQRDKIGECKVAHETREENDAVVVDTDSTLLSTPATTSDRLKAAHQFRVRAFMCAYIVFYVLFVVAGEIFRTGDPHVARRCGIRTSHWRVWLYLAYASLPMVGGLLYFQVSPRQHLVDSQQRKMLLTVAILPAAVSGIILRFVVLVTVMHKHSRRSRRCYFRGPSAHFFTFAVMLFVVVLTLSAYDIVKQWHTNKATAHRSTQACGAGSDGAEQEEEGKPSTAQARSTEDGDVVVIYTSASRSSTRTEPSSNVRAAQEFRARAIMCLYIVFCALFVVGSDIIRIRHPHAARACRVRSNDWHLWLFFTYVCLPLVGGLLHLRVSPSRSRDKDLALKTMLSMAMLPVTVAGIVLWLLIASHMKKRHRRHQVCHVYGPVWFLLSFAVAFYSTVLGWSVYDIASSWHTRILRSVVVAPKSTKRD